MASFNYKIFLSAAIIFFSLSLFLYITAFAQLNPFNIQFPISELGNCGSMEECKTYCDNSANAQVCADWAVSKGLAQPAPKNEYQEKSREIIEQREGPGGCKSQTECNTFCSQSEHSEECFNFAKEHNLMPSKEIRRIEKEMSGKIGPGGCRSRQECDSFCRNPDNNKICLNFAVQEGKITQEEADFMSERTKMMRPPSGPGDKFNRPGRPMPPQIDKDKAKQLLADKGGPGGCKTMEECGDFCDKPENGEICLNFAVENGLMPAQEIERAKKMMEAKGPGGCRGRECEAYCDNSDHGEECLNFAVEQGFIGKDEAEQARKFVEIGKKGGPGGCRGPKECDAFCSQPEHREECFNFAKENGLMPLEEIQRMERGREIINKLEAQGGGPGNCRSENECRQYCMNSTHFDECAAFSVKEGMMDMDKAKGMMREFTDIDEKKFDRFGPPGFMMAPPLSQDGFRQPPDKFGPPVDSDEKFKQRFEMFKKYGEEFKKQEFKEQEDFCNKPENAEQCRKSMPGIPMMPSRERGIMPPGESMPGNAPQLNLPQKFQEEFNKSGEFHPPYGEFQKEQYNMPYRNGEFAPAQGLIPPQGLMPPTQNQQQQNIMPFDQNQAPYFNQNQIPTEFAPPTQLIQPTQPTQ